MEKNKMEIIVRSQDGREYSEFMLPLSVQKCGDGYSVLMDYDIIGGYKEEKHAVHVMNYLLAQRNHYMFDDVPNIKSVILSVPTDELVRETPDENLLDGIPQNGDKKNETNN